MAPRFAVRRFPARRRETPAPTCGPPERRAASAEALRSPSGSRAAFRVLGRGLAPNWSGLVVKVGASFSLATLGPWAPHFGTRAQAAEEAAASPVPAAPVRRSAERVVPTGVVWRQKVVDARLKQDIDLPLVVLRKI